MADLTLLDGFNEGILEASLGLDKSVLPPKELSPFSTEILLISLGFKSAEVEYQSPNAGTHVLVFNAETNNGLTEDFVYPGGTPDIGELPTNNIGAIHFRNGANVPLFDASGFAFSFTEFTDAWKNGTLNKLLLSSSDRISGNNQGNSIASLAGDDKVFGKGGNDTIHGNAGNDSLNGDVGADKLYGDAGNDTVLGGDGKDIIYGNADNDLVAGGAGNDTAYGGIGVDTVQGGDGKDKLYGEAGSDRMDGGRGKDILTGGAGKDIFDYRNSDFYNGVTSGLGTSNRDIITDFKSGKDDFDFTNVSGLHFHFKGTGALKVQGDIHYKFVGADTLVEVNTDADIAAEMQILLNGHINLKLGDFIL